MTQRQRYPTSTSHFDPGNGYLNGGSAFKSYLYWGYFSALWEIKLEDIAPNLAILFDIAQRDCRDVTCLLIDSILNRQPGFLIDPEGYLCERGLRGRRQLDHRCGKRANRLIA